MEDLTPHLNQIAAVIVIIIGLVIAFGMSGLKKSFSQLGKLDNIDTILSDIKTIVTDLNALVRSHEKSEERIKLSNEFFRAELLRLERRIDRCEFSTKEGSNNHSNNNNGNKE